MSRELFSLSRKEGWRRFVDAPPRQRPELLSARELAGLGEAAWEGYNEARHDWHANFGILRTFGRGFDRAQIRRHGPVTAQGHERVPVLRVGLTSNTTLRTLNRMNCQFYGHPATDRASAAQLASHAVDCVLSCQTQIGIIDFTDRSYSCS